MFPFKKFLCCLELETGGKILGWAGIICNILLLIGVTLGVIFGTAALGVLGLEMAKSKSSSSSSSVMYMETPDNKDDSGTGIAAMIGVGAGVFILLLIVVYLLLIVRLWASHCLLTGTKRHDHRRVLKYVIVDGIVMIITLPHFYYSRSSGIVDELIMVYLSLCTFSLYKKFLNQSKENSTRFELASVGAAANYPSVPQQQQVHGTNGYSQVPTNPQPQVYPQPQGYPQPQVYPQLSGSQDTSKYAQANSPSAPPKF